MEVNEYKLAFGSAHPRNGSGRWQRQLESLQQQVNQLIQEGWQPQGGVAFQDTTFVQALGRAQTEAPPGPGSSPEPPSAPVAVTAMLDLLPGALQLAPQGAPGASILSDPIDHGLRGDIPLVVAVQRIDTNAPPGEFVNVVVTPYCEPGSTEFRIGATNLSQRTVSRLFVRWWALQY